MKWVTRSFPHVDRTASAWLIKRYIDPEAEFTFIDWPEQELKPEHGTPFDIKGVELGHHDNKCSFETIVEKYNIKDPIVEKIAQIVHAADIKGEMEKATEAPGVKALFSGLRLITRDDYETLEYGMKVWDALYVHYKALDLEEKHKQELEGLSKTMRLRRLKELLNQ